MNLANLGWTERLPADVTVPVTEGVARSTFGQRQSWLLERLADEPLLAVRSWGSIGRWSRPDNFALWTARTVGLHNVAVLEGRACRRNCPAPSDVIIARATCPCEVSVAFGAVPLDEVREKANTEALTAYIQGVFRGVR